jgi:hypothetical protein
MTTLFRVITKFVSRNSFVTKFHWEPYLQQFWVQSKHPKAQTRLRVADEALVNTELENRQILEKKYNSSGYDVAYRLYNVWDENLKLF